MRIVAITNIRMKTAAHEVESHADENSDLTGDPDSNVSRRRVVKVTFDDGDSLVTQINGTKDEITEYYMMNDFVLQDEDTTHRGIFVEFLKDDSSDQPSQKRVAAKSLWDIRKYAQTFPPGYVPQEGLFGEPYGPVQRKNTELPYGAKPIGSGYWSIPNGVADELCGGTLPKDGYERVVNFGGSKWAIHKTPHFGKMVWGLRWVKEVDPVKTAGKKPDKPCPGCGKVGLQNSECKHCHRRIPGKPISSWEGSWAQQEEARKAKKATCLWELKKVAGAGGRVRKNDRGVNKDLNNALKMEKPDRPDKAFSRSEFSQAIEASMSILSKSEQKVIKMRFGFGVEDEQPMSYQEIAEACNADVGLVKRIENNALEKIKNHAMDSALGEYGNRVAAYVGRLLTAGKILPDDGYADGGEPYTDEEIKSFNTCKICGHDNGGDIRCKCRITRETP